MKKSRLILMDDPAGAGEAALDLVIRAMRREDPITWMGYEASDFERLAALDVEIHGGPRAHLRRFGQLQGSDSLGWRSEIGGGSQAVAELMSSLVDEEGAGQWTPRLSAMVFAAIRGAADSLEAAGEPVTLEALEYSIVLERLIELSESPAVSQGSQEILLDYFSSIPGYVKGAQRQSDTALDQHGYLQMLQAKVFAVFHELTQCQIPSAPKEPRWEGLGSRGRASHLAMLSRLPRRGQVGAADLAFGFVKLGLKAGGARDPLDEDAPPRSIFARDCPLPSGFRQTLDLASQAGATVVLQFESAPAMRALMRRPEEFLEIRSWFEREELRAAVQPHVGSSGKSRPARL